MSRKATQKMIDYAQDISEWVVERMPNSDDFLVISAYIDRNVSAYRDAIGKWQAEIDAMMSSRYS